MHVREGQCLGALVILIVSALVYGGSFLQPRQGISPRSIPWGDCLPGTIAMEVSGSRGSDGVYFLPQGISFDMVKKCVGVEGAMEPSAAADMPFRDHTTLAISPEERIMKASRMGGLKRLALGLPIDINLATEEELTLVPGVGERLAALIVRHRLAQGEIASLSELVAIPGIKDKKLSQLKKYLEVSANR
jgi:hypothetical protein